MGRRRGRHCRRPGDLAWCHAPLASVLGQARRVAATRVRRGIWSRAARDDLRGIRGYIEQFNPFAAERVALALIEAVDSLADVPERGRLIGVDRRELIAVWP